MKKAKVFTQNTVIKVIVRVSVVSLHVCRIVEHNRRISHTQLSLIVAQVYACQETQLSASECNKFKLQLFTSL